MATSGDALDPPGETPSPSASGGSGNTEILYYFPPTIMKIVGFNNHRQFAAGFSDDAHVGQYTYVVGDWNDPGRVRAVVPWSADWTTVFVPAHEALTDAGILIGSRNYLGPGLYGQTYFSETAWVDTATQAVHANKGPRNAYWIRASRGGQAGGFAETFEQELATCGTWHDPVTTSVEVTGLVGRYDSPRAPPVLDARSMSCTVRTAGLSECEHIPSTVALGLGETITAVNDLGEAVGFASVRLPEASCSWPLLVWTGIDSRPIYIGPSGAGVYDLTSALRPFVTLPSASDEPLRGINNAGTIVGVGLIAGRTTAFRYNIHSGVFETPPLPGGSAALAINSVGSTLVRWVGTPSGRPRTVVWMADDQVLDLEYDFNQGVSINDENQVIASWCEYQAQYCALGRWDLGSTNKISIVVAPADAPGNRATTFSMAPSVIPEKFPPRLQILGLVLQCIGPRGEVLQNCDLSFSWSVEAGSGGHGHNTARPPGRIVTQTSNAVGGSIESGPGGSVSDSTSGSGALGITYVAPEASGTTNIDIVASAIVDGVRESTATPTRVVVDVGIPGLMRVDAAGLDVYQRSTLHGFNNGYADPAMYVAMWRLGGYFGEYTRADGWAPKNIPVTALSLPAGGLFDYKYEWMPPHKSHRFGRDADILVYEFSNDNRVLALEAAITEAGLGMPVSYESDRDPSSTHWHLSL